jgi:hypothetical protein
MMAAVQPVIPIFLAFIPFSIFNLYANYKSSLYVTTKTLNIPRAEVMIYDLLNQLGGASKTLPNNIRDLVPSPRKISSEEVFVRRYHSPFDIPLEIEPALHHYDSKRYAHDLHAALKQEGFLHPEEYFILHVPYHHMFGKKHPHHHHIRLPGNRQHLSIWFSQKADTRDMIKGFCHACAIRYTLKYVDSATSENRDQVLNIIRDAHTLIENSFEGIFNALESKGWETEHVFFSEREDCRLFVEK